MTELKLTISLKKAANGFAELEFTSKADFEGVQFSDGSYSLRAGDTLSILIPLAESTALPPEDHEAELARRPGLWMDEPPIETLSVNCGSTKEVCHR